MPRMTNNSLQNVVNIDLTSNTKKSTKVPSPAKPPTKKQTRSSKLSALLLRPSPIREEPEELEEPPKRALDFKRPRLPSGHLHGDVDWLRPPPQPQFAPMRHQYVTRLPGVSALTLLPSPTFSDSADNVQPGQYTDQRNGHTFPIDEEMIDAAKILMMFSRPDTNDMAQRAALEAERSVNHQFLQSPVRFSTSVSRGDNEQQSPYETWKQGDARHHIVDSGLSPKARRIRDLKTRLDALPLTAAEKRKFLKTMTAKVKKPTQPVKHTDEAYFSNPTLKAINDSPPKRRRANQSVNCHDDSEDDTTEVEDDDGNDNDADMEDPDYQESPPPIQPSPWVRKRGRARLLPPPVRRKPRNIESDSNHEQEIEVEDEDEEDILTGGHIWQAPSPESPDLPPVRPYRQIPGWNRLSAPPRMLLPRSSSASEDSDSEVEKEQTPPRPSTSPISRTPSRVVSRKRKRSRTTSTEYHTPVSDDAQTQVSPSSLEKWQCAARQSQAHRRTASLESFLERSRKKFIR